MLQDSLNGGEAQLHVATVAGQSAVVSSRARSPVRLLTPRSRGESVWAYTTSFGGGMVAGDCTRLDLKVDAGAKCFLSTQSSTKIYRNPGVLPCSHTLSATIENDSLLVLAPDPVQCFADSTYDQSQRFNLGMRANLLLIDWMSAGRVARGERWNFRHYASRNEIHREGIILLLDAVRLNVADGPLDAAFRAGPFHCFATVVVIGPQLAQDAAGILDWTKQQPIRPGADMLFAASPCHEGVILRFAGLSVEQVGRAIRERLHFIPDLLNDDPWLRKW